MSAEAYFIQSETIYNSVVFYHFATCHSSFKIKECKVRITKKANLWHVLLDDPMKCLSSCKKARGSAPKSTENTHFMWDLENIL